MDCGRFGYCKEGQTQWEIYFVRPTAGHAYVIEASIDGKVWQEFAVHQDRKMCSPHTDVLNKRFRYLRIKILKRSPRYLGMEYLLISQRGRWQYENCMDSNQLYAFLITIDVDIVLS